MLVGACWKGFAISEVEGCEWKVPEMSRGVAVDSKGAEVRVCGADGVWLAEVCSWLWFPPQLVWVVLVLGAGAWFVVVCSVVWVAGAWVAGGLFRYKVIE